MTAVQAWMLAGVLVAGGVACLVWWLMPAQPDLADVLARLSPAGPAQDRPRPAGPEGEQLADRLGWWLARRFPAGWVRTPSADLALLGVSPHVFYGQKVLFVVLAVVAVPVLSWLFSFTFTFPLLVPAGLTVAAAVVAWLLPNQNVADAASRARAEFARALGSYVDLVALERNAGGSGTRQALENAARVGDAWQFRRLADELARTRFAGEAPWDGLSAMAERLRLPELADLADIMRLAGEEGSQVYDTLRARSSALRSAMLTADQTRANQVGEQMTVPTTAMAMVFVTIIITPAILRLMTG